MASFKAKFPVLQELFAKNHRGGPLGPPSGARVKIGQVSINTSEITKIRNMNDNRTTLSTNVA